MRLLLYTSAFILVFSACSKSNNQNQILSSAIQDRLSILSKSFRYEIYRINKKTIDCNRFDRDIRDAINKINNGSFSDNEMNNLNHFIQDNVRLIDNNEAEMALIDHASKKSEIVNYILLTELLVLDKVIFQVRNMDNSFSCLRAVVSPVTEENIKTGKDYQADIYLSAWDSLFDPIITINTPTGPIRMIVDSFCVGKYRCGNSFPGKQTFSGEIEIKDENGQTIKYPFQHSYNVK
jgi:hypothetical protein